MLASMKNLSEEEKQELIKEAQKRLQDFLATLE